MISTGAARRSLVMGKLLDALKPISSYAAKKTDLWPDLLDRIAGALVPADLDGLESWLVLHELEIPWAWREPLAELIEKRRDELAADDVNEIVRVRFDFT
jgi:hypothetical protein